MSRLVFLLMLSSGLSWAPAGAQEFASDFQNWENLPAAHRFAWIQCNGVTYNRAVLAMPRFGGIDHVRSPAFARELEAILDGEYSEATGQQEINLKRFRLLWSIHELGLHALAPKLRELAAREDVFIKFRRDAARTLILLDPHDPFPLQWFDQVAQEIMDGQRQDIALGHLASKLLPLFPPRAAIERAERIRDWAFRADAALPPARKPEDVLKRPSFTGVTGAANTVENEMGRLLKIEALEGRAFLDAVFTEFPHYWDEPKLQMVRRKGMQDAFIDEARARLAAEQDPKERMRLLVGIDALKGELSAEELHEIEQTYGPADPLIVQICTELGNYDPESAPGVIRQRRIEDLEQRVRDLILRQAGLEAPPSGGPQARNLKAHFDLWASPAHLLVHAVADAEGGPEWYLDTVEDFAYTFDDPANKPPPRHLARTMEDTRRVGMAEQLVAPGVREVRAERLQAAVEELRRQLGEPAERLDLRGPDDGPVPRRQRAETINALNWEAAHAHAERLANSIFHARVADVIDDAEFGEPTSWRRPVQEVLDDALPRDARLTAGALESALGRLVESVFWRAVAEKHDRTRSLYQAAVRSAREALAASR